MRGGDDGQAGRPDPGWSPVAAVDLQLAAWALGAGIGRGIRTPLHSMLGFLELLATTEVSEEQDRLLEQVLNGAEALLTASERLPLLAEALHGPVQPSPRSVHLGDLLAAGASRRVDVQVDPRLPERIWVDGSRLGRVLRELVDNALRHGGGPVSVSAAPDSRGDEGPSGVRLVVRDRGPGLPGWAAAVLSGAGTDAGTFGETHRDGSGLVLVRHLAAQLSAGLAVRTGAGGTEVTVLLPFGDADHDRRLPESPGLRPAPVPTAQAGPGTGGTGLLVLLVEDNAVNRLLAERQLARLGHQVVSVGDGAAAVERALSGRFDVVLMDRHLPGLDGLTATRAIRAAEATRAGDPVPIVAVTADASPASGQECLAAGMNDYLMKPVDLERLGAALTRATADPGQATGTGEDGPDGGALARLAEQLGDGELPGHLVRAYLQELPGRRLRMQAAGRRGVAGELLAAAESLRASSATIGASSVSDACAAVAAAARAGDLPTARAALGDLLDRCQHVEERLTRYLASASPR